MSNAGADAPVRFIEVTKTFSLGLWKRKVAVDKLSFSLGTGQVVGLLGPNGSGKSTILKMLLGFLRPTCGKILLYGKSPTECLARAAVGYLPENPRFQKFLSAEALMLYYGRLLSLSGKRLRERVKMQLQHVGLQSVARERVGGFSKGMIQRLAMAQALLSEPEILILDEPMSGLDPEARVHFRSILEQIRHLSPKTSILFSTHLMADVERLCDTVLVLNEGKLERWEAVTSLMEQSKMGFEVILKEPPLNWQGGARLSSGRYVVTVAGVEALRAQLEALKQTGAVVVGIVPTDRKPSDFHTEEI